jgi:hypothetical protein
LADIVLSLIIIICVPSPNKNQTTSWCCLQTDVHRQSLPHCTTSALLTHNRHTASEVQLHHLSNMISSFCNYFQRPLTCFTFVTCSIGMLIILVMFQTYYLVSIELGKNTTNPNYLYLKKKTQKTQGNCLNVTKMYPIWFRTWSEEYHSIVWIISCDKSFWPGYDREDNQFWLF